MLGSPESVVFSVSGSPDDPVDIVTLNDLPLSALDTIYMAPAGGILDGSALHAMIAFHYRLTWPLANLVLLLLALPFAVHFERGSKIGRVILAIAICGGYLVVDLTCQNLGRQEYLHPIVASWTPTILFGSLGMVMFGGMRT